MSNEHLPQRGQSATEDPVDDNGPDDDGGLDPSVFFGLFDDLADEGFEAESIQPAAEPPANGSGPVDVEFLDALLDQPDDRNDAIADNQALQEFEQAEVPEAEPADEQPVEEPVEEPVDEAGAPEAEPVEKESVDEQPLQEQPVEESDRPDEPMFIASPPLIPPQPDPVDNDSHQPLDTLGIGTVPVVDVAETNGSAQSTTPLLAPLTDPDTSGPSTPEPPIDDGGGTMAKAALATIAVGLLAGLVVAFVISLRSPDPTVGGVAQDQATATEPDQEPAASSVVDQEPVTTLAEAITAGQRPDSTLLADHVAATLPAALASRADFTALQFQPGTTTLDSASAAIVAQLGAVLAQQSTSPVTVTVRTYSEAGAAENQALSEQQAEALVAALVAAGASPDQVRGQGLGAGPLSRAQPVPNFVAVTPEFGDHRFDETLRTQSPFGLGLPAAATAADDVWPLRLDGLLPASALAQVLTTQADIAVGLAGYSFFPPSEAEIRREADATAAELTDFLVSAYGVDPAQVDVINAGPAVFVPSAEHGNHVWLQIGPASQGAFDVAAIDPAAITFSAGSAELDATGAATVATLAETLMAGGATIVMDVRSYDGADDASNLALSEARRDILADTLVDAGVAPEQLRMYASGASTYYAPGSSPDITITVVP